MKKMIGYVLAALGGGVLIYALVMYLGPQKGPVFGYDPVYAGLAAIAVLTAGIVTTQQ